MMPSLVIVARVDMRWSVWTIRQLWGSIFLMLMLPSAGGTVVPGFLSISELFIWAMSFLWPWLRRTIRR